MGYPLERGIRSFFVDFIDKFLAFIWKGICRDEAHGVGSLNPFKHMHHLHSWLVMLSVILKCNFCIPFALPFCEIIHCVAIVSGLLS